MKKTIIDTEFAKKFNSIRMKYCGQKLPKEKFKSIFKEELNLKIDSVWISQFIKFEVIEKIKQNKKRGYVFSYKPVFIEKLKNIYSEVNKIRNYYNRNQIMKKKAPKIESSIVEEVQIIDPIEEAIKLLKNNGYKVYKPIIEFKEI